MQSYFANKQSNSPQFKKISKEEQSDYEQKILQLNQKRIDNQTVRNNQFYEQNLKQIRQKQLLTDLKDQQTVQTINEQKLQSAKVPRLFVLTKPLQVPNTKKVKNLIKEEIKQMNELTREKWTKAKSTPKYLYETQILKSTVKELKHMKTQKLNKTETKQLTQENSAKQKETELQTKRQQQIDLRKQIIKQQEKQWLNNFLEIKNRM
ncbi:Hypothetical_protein [Hexamita inflata]|uniref:Hypothetical_protein n=1 Tax=Hexamita inflata TaxID=28002 RepID=A0ABP1H9X3_9EUKA